MKPPASPIANLGAVVLVFMGLNPGCTRAPNLTEYDEQSNKQARSAPLVVVGVVDSDALVGRPLPSRDDPNYAMLLHRARVQVENVLRGSLDKRTIFIYYFSFGGGFDGSRPLGFGSRPSRRILWLRRDAGVLRMACDGWDGCTMLVMSGAHPRYEADPRKSLDYALVDILLTRGEGEIDDIRFASEVEWGVPDRGLQRYVIEKLRHLALTETSAVRSAACVYLWIYTQDRFDSSLGQNAKDSLQAAKCACSTKPDGNVVCR